MSMVLTKSNIDARATKELSEAVETLVLFQLNGMVPAADKEFVQSLCLQHEQKGMLSEKQRMWVFKLMHKFMGLGEVQVVISDGAGTNYEALFAMLEKAAETLQKPKLYFTLESGFNLKVARGYHGDSINVSRHNPYQKIGWISKGSDQFNKSKFYKDVDTLATLVIPFLKMLADNPERMVVKYGLLANSCCFCNLPLTDPKSVHAGYGPVCADHYGLPWGNK